MTEEEIIDLIRRQDDAGMSALSERYEKLLIYIIRGILGDRQDDVEECVNDTWLKIWRNVDRYDFEKASLATWLKVIARNTALNRLRDVRRHEEQRADGELSEFADTVADARQNVENQIVRKEQAARLNEAVRRLPDRERELMLRKYFYLQSSKTIASAMGMTVNAVDTKLSRLRGRMREEFSEWGQEGGMAENDRGNACESDE
ncbi:MAG: sigma-70 family RNA polymerase sigma factor [Lachnospiraceae bacterium]|nr:sigma-70 family RNA polymerase sigma factor [Lachnospiraceae bacterium]